jgi:hypothetical protein
LKLPFEKRRPTSALGRLLSFGAVAERNAADYYRPPKSDVCDTSTGGNLNSRTNLIIDACYIRHEQTFFLRVLLR